MHDRFVVDATVVAKLYLRDEQHTAEADLLFSRFGAGKVTLVAPRIITYEVPAAISRGAARVKAAGQEVWEKALQSFESLGLAILDDYEAKHEAMKLAMNYVCHYYDALYLVLAEDLGYRFITDDRKLIRSVGNKAPYVLSLENYS